MSAFDDQVGNPFGYGSRMSNDVPVPQGPSAPLSQLATGVKAARFVAVIVLVCGTIATLQLVTYQSWGDAGRERPFWGVGVGVGGLSLGIATLLLFLAGWAETSLERRDR